VTLSNALKPSGSILE